MNKAPERTVIWHAKPDVRKGWLRDFGLSCGHVLVHRVMAKICTDRGHIPEKMGCPCCAAHTAPVPVWVPAHANRTPIGLRRQRESERAASAQRLAQLPISQPSGTAGQPINHPPRQTSQPRPSQVFSPRDLAARNYD